MCVHVDIVLPWTVLAEGVSLKMCEDCVVGEGALTFPRAVWELLLGKSGNFFLGKSGNFFLGQSGNFFPEQSGNFFPGQSGNFFPGQSGNFFPEHSRNFFPGQSRNFFLAWYMYTVRSLPSKRNRQTSDELKGWGNGCQACKFVSFPDVVDSRLLFALSKYSVWRFSSSSVVT